MTIQLHIERLILDGIDLSRPQQAVLGTAVETELTQLLAEGGLSPKLHAGGAVPTLAADAIQLESHRNPAGLGQQIARSVYGGMSE